MIIKKDILQQIDNTTNRINICQKLGIGEQALISHINANKDNGRLTKLEALQAISEETGIAVTDLTEELEKEADSPLANAS